MADVATYFEERGELEKAVQLYQRAGDISRALDLCFRAAAAQVLNST
jgi:intraflagellar transport protein 140